jgi:hypothetical protein
MILGEMFRQTEFDNRYFLAQKQELDQKAKSTKVFCNLSRVQIASVSSCFSEEELGRRNNTVQTFFPCWSC